MSDQEQQLQVVRQGRKKGGLITMPFIIANEAFEKVSSYGLLPNMILYLMQEYGMGLAGGTHVIFLWSAATNFMPVVGAFIADSYLGRFLAISLGSIISLLGMILIWLTAMIPKLRAPPCAGCKPASPAQLGILYTSFALMSVGAGGIRPCSPGFGADQLDKRDDDSSSNKRLLESYFSWYYAAASSAVLVSLTGIVYIQDHLGWNIGFAVPAALMFVSASLFLVASSLYVKYDVSTNLFASFAHVIVASCTKRKVPFPSQSTGDKYYHHEKEGSTLLVPTNKLRFLNKACIIRRHDEEVASDGSAVNPWRTCTVDQVEQLKSLIRILPMWSTSIMMSINTSQSTFQFVQAEAMDRHLTRSFEIPAGSFIMFLVITMIVWIPIYDRAIIPLASKIYGKPVRLGVKLRMVIGLFFCALSMVVAGVVEHVRRGRAIETMLLNNTSEPVITMSAMWLIPQYVLQGVGEAFNVVGQLEFYYSEFPTSMVSLASALYWLGIAVANLLASAILSVVDDVTSKNGRTSWVTSDVNAARLDSYYWVLAALGFANVAYYMVCSFFYGPCSREVVKNEESNVEQEMSFEGRVVRMD